MRFGVFKDFGVIFHPKTPVIEVENFVKEKLNAKANSEASSKVRQASNERTRLVGKAEETEQRWKVLWLIARMQNALILKIANTSHYELQEPLETEKNRRKTKEPGNRKERKETKKPKEPKRTKKSQKNKQKRTKKITV